MTRRRRRRERVAYNRCRRLQRRELARIRKRKNSVTARLMSNLIRGIWPQWNEDHAQD